MQSEMDAMAAPPSDDGNGGEHDEVDVGTRTRTEVMYWNINEDDLVSFPAVYAR